MQVSQVITGLRGGNIKGKQVLQSPSNHLLDADRFTPGPIWVLDAKKKVVCVCVYVYIPGPLQGQDRFYRQDSLYLFTKQLVNTPRG